jgi:hypothetical protein
MEISCRLSDLCSDVSLPFVDGFNVTPSKRSDWGFGCEVAITRQ